MHYHSMMYAKSFVMDDKSKILLFIFNKSGDVDLEQLNQNNDYYNKIYMFLLSEVEQNGKLNLQKVLNNIDTHFNLLVNESLIKCLESSNIKLKDIPDVVKL